MSGLTDGQVFYLISSCILICTSISERSAVVPGIPGFSYHFSLHHLTFSLTILLSPMFFTQELLARRDSGFGLLWCGLTLQTLPRTLEFNIHRSGWLLPLGPNRTSRSYPSGLCSLQISTNSVISSQTPLSLSHSGYQAISCLASYGGLPMTYPFCSRSN